MSDLGNLFQHQSRKEIIAGLQKSLTFAHTHLIECFCHPLHNLGVMGFFYMRIYPDGTFIDFLSRVVEPWSLHYFSQFFQEKYTPSLVKQHMSAKQRFIFWDSHPDNVIWRESQQFGFRHGVSINHFSEGYQEIFCFFTDKDAAPLYLEQRELLEQFIPFFLEKAEPLIRKAAKKPWLIPKNYQINPQTISANEKKEKVLRFLRELNYKSFKMQIDDHYCSLTLREAVILYQFSQGESAKEIAQKLRKNHNDEVSYRTIERHASNIMKKTGYKKMAKIIDLANQYGIEKIAPYLNCL